VKKKRRRPKTSDRESSSESDLDLSASVISAKVIADCPKEPTIPETDSADNTNTRSAESGLNAVDLNALVDSLWRGLGGPACGGRVSTTTLLRDWKARSEAAAKAAEAGKDQCK